MRRCSHQWVEVSREFTPPPPVTKVRSSSEEFGYGLAFGVTSIELRCAMCSDIKESRLLGNHTVSATGRGVEA